MNRCRVCRHSARASIDLLLVNGVSIRDIAGQFCLARSSLQRHREAHLPAALLRARETREYEQSAALEARLGYIARKANGALTAAEAEAEKGLTWQARNAHRKTLLRACAELTRIEALREEVRILEAEVRLDQTLGVDLEAEEQEGSVQEEEA